MAVVRMSLDASQFESKSNKQPSSTQPKRNGNSFNFSVSPRSKQILKNSISKKKNKRFPVKLLLLIGTIGMISIFAAPKIWGAVKNVSSAVSEVVPIIPAIAPELKQDELGRTNFLLVGIDTRNGGPLELNTDTIILASYDNSTNRVSMLSYPRDLGLTYPTTGYIGRINGIYASAENNKTGSGLETLKTEIEKISNTEIHYYGMVNLKGFMDAVDTIGGIDVYVDTAMSGSYPVGANYITVKFDQGWNHLDGNKALKYARIRKDVIPWEEGNDFARAKRQQKVIQAIIEKVTKTDTLMDPQKVLGLLSVASDNVTLSDYTVEDIQAGINILKDDGKPEMFNYVLDLNAGGSEGRLISLVSYNPWMIGPRLGYDKWGEIQQLIKVYFDEPLLLTMDKKIRVYGVSNNDFDSKFNALKTKYYYTDFEKGNSTNVTPELTGKVYSVGGDRYNPLAKYLAKSLGIEVGTDSPEMFKSGDWGGVAVVVIF